ncbi:MAG TPA: sigma-70 family RNA polymerase sigma factor [Bryobacteraceae bacterium]
MREQGMSTQAIYNQLYADLRLLAHKKVGPAAPGLSATSVVHTLWMRVFDKQPAEWVDGRHFVSYMARSMQNLLIDEARKPHPGPIPPTTEGSGSAWKERLNVSEALQHLEADNERQAEIVRLVLVAGLTQEEAAEVLDCSLSTVKKEFRKAKAWLRDYLDQGA